MTVDTQPAVGALLDAVGRDCEPQRRTDWPERDLVDIALSEGRCSGVG